MKKTKRNASNIMAKEYIVSALLQLIREKPLSAITISELTAKAGVSRMTFYRNYTSKEEIFSLHLKEILDRYEEDDRRQQLKGIYYDRSHMIHCFQYWYEYREFFDGMVYCGFGNIFLENVTKYIQRKWLTESSSPQEFYRLSCFAGSLYNLYISWSSNQYQESIEELAQILYTIYKKP